MEKVILSILSVLMSVAAIGQDIDFYVKEVGNGNHNPEIHCIKPLNTNLKIYRRYSYESEFQYIDSKTFNTPNDSYVDKSITICYNEDQYIDESDNNIYYYITNNDSTSFSEEKGGRFGDSNNPEWPKITRLDIENNNLVIHWESSISEDIHHYELRKQNLSGGWDSIHSYYKYSSPITIAENICDSINVFNFPYTIFATDLCGNPSLIGELDETKNYLYPPVLESVEYDNCDTLSFKWSKNRSLSGEITGCQIQYKSDYTAQDTKDIDIRLSDIDTSEPDHQIYKLKVSDYTELRSNNDSLYFRIRTTAGQYSSSTCWFGPVTIIDIPDAPDFSIVSVKTAPDNSENEIELSMTDNNPNPYSDREYVLSRDYGSNTPEIIWSSNDNEIFRYSNQFTTTISNTISNINSHINYRLSVIYKCNDNTPLTLDETLFNSIHLVKVDNDAEFKLSWNSISAGSYDNITYNVVRTYDGEDYTEDVQNSTTYINDLSFVEPNSFKPANWHVEAINNEGITIAVSNTITLKNSGKIEMPDAFIPDSDIKINRFFGPMNKFDENDIRKYRLLIFNNSGTLIWSTEKYSSDMEDDTSRWNGKDFRGQPCVRGTYIYEVYMEFKDASITPLTSRGTVTLIRNN